MMWALAGTAFRRKLLDDQVPKQAVPPLPRRESSTIERQQQKNQQASSCPPQSFSAPSNATNIALLFNIKWNPATVIRPTS
eukprot:2899073-Pleurochrysis_carterae.AAC.1